MQERVGIGTVAVERAEEAHGLVDGELLGELRLLQRDAHALAQLALVVAPVHAQDLDDAGVGRGESFQDLDGRGLAGAIRAEEAEAFAALDDEVEAVDGFHVGKVLPQVAAGDRCFGHESGNTTTWARTICESGCARLE